VGNIEITARPDKDLVHLHIPVAGVLFSCLNTGGSYRFGPPVKMWLTGKYSLPVSVLYGLLYHYGAGDKSPEASEVDYFTARPITMTP
jgi:hypothetical protein